MYRDDEGELVGYCIDLFDEIGKRLGFNYTIKVNTGSAYGSCKKEEDGSRTCTGMVKEVVDKVSGNRSTSAHSGNTRIMVFLRIGPRTSVCEWMGFCFICLTIFSQ